MERTKAFIGGVRRRLAAAAVIEQGTLWLLASLVLLVPLLVLDCFLPLPLIVRRMYAFAVAALAAVATLRFLRSVKAFLFSDEQVIRVIQSSQRQFGDELLSAWQLRGTLPEGISAALVEGLQRSVEERSGAVPPSAVLPLAGRTTRSRALCVAGLCSFIVLAAVLPPHFFSVPLARFAHAFSGTPWQSTFAVLPGSGDRAWGSGVTISVIPRQAPAGKPTLKVRYGKASWRREELRRGDEGDWRFSIERLTETTAYRVSWGEADSPVFRLVPVQPPQLGSFKVRCRYPAYTGMQEQETAGAPHINAPAGTKVTVSGLADKELAEVRVAASFRCAAGCTVKGREFSVSFPVTADGTYRIAARGVDGTVDPEPAEYSVTVAKDLRPEVELLSPDGDLVVDGQSEIPLVIRARDDFGLSRATLVCQREGEQPVQTVIAAFPAGTYQKNFEYVWKIDRLRLKPGAKLRYYVEVWDNDAVAGSKSAATPVRTVEITDYAREHAKIEEELKGVRDRLLDALADQTVLREGLKGDLAPASTTWQELRRRQAGVDGKLEQPLRSLEGLLARMENDPLTDFSTYSEYKGLSSHLQHLRNGPLQGSMKALDSRDRDSALKAMDEVVAELEKMGLLSEDIWQYQRMRDLFAKGSQLEKKAASLREGLNGKSSPDDLKASLKDIQDLLEQINEQIAKLPQELPEDFVNAPAVKNIDLAAQQELTEKLNAAIARGDWEQARRLAAELQKNLSSMMETLRSVGSDCGFSPDADAKLQEDILRYGRELQRIAAAQEKVVASLESREGVRRQELFARQEQQLASLYERQRRLVADAEQLQRKMQARSGYLSTLAEQDLNLMRKVLDEFRHRRVYHSQKYLEDVVTGWGNVRRVVMGGEGKMPEAVARDIAGGIDAVARGEEEILKALRAPVATGPVSGQEEAEMRSAAADETKLSGETKKLRGSLEAFMRRSAAVEPGTFDNLGAAAGEMNAAAGTLKDGNGSAALGHARGALERLREGVEGMQRAGEQMGRMGQKAGSGMASPMRLRTGGAAGMREGRVELPRIDEYKPPRAFRQEIMDALKEHYPQQYEKIIKDYYRRLTE